MLQEVVDLDMVCESAPQFLSLFDLQLWVLFHLPVNTNLSFRAAVAMDGRVSDGCWKESLKRNTMRAGVNRREEGTVLLDCPMVNTIYRWDFESSAWDSE